MKIALWCIEILLAIITVIYSKSLKPDIVVLSILFTLSCFAIPSLILIEG